MGEISDYENQVKDASSQLKDLGGSRTIEELQNEMQRLNDEAKAIKRRINILVSDKDTARHTATVLDGQVRDIRLKLSELNSKLQQSRGLIARIDECRENTTKQNNVIEEIDTQIRELTPRVSRADAHVRAISQDGAEKENRHQRDATKLAESDMQLRKAEQLINNYLNRGGPEQLDRCHRQAQELQAEVRGYEGEVASISNEVNSLEIESASASATERSIKENLRFRKNKRDLGRLNLEIRELESRDAETERERFQRNLDLLSNKHMRLSSDVSNAHYLTQTHAVFLIWTLYRNPQRQER